MRALVKHAWPLWVAFATPLHPRLSLSGRGRAPGLPQGLYIPLSFCQFEIYSHLLREEELSAGPEAGGCREVLGTEGPSAWENTHPHARTCFHSEKCVLDHGKISFQAAPGCTDLFPSPWQEICVCHLWKVRTSLGVRASSDLCHGGETCFAGVRGEQGYRACDFLAVPQAPPWVVWWPRVTVREHITSRVSRR